MPNSIIINKNQKKTASKNKQIFNSKIISSMQEYKDFNSFINKC